MRLAAPRGGLPGAGTTGGPEQDAVALVDRAMRAAPVSDRLVLTPAGLAMESVADAPPVVAAMAAVARDGAALLTDPARTLRPCHEPCVLFFVRDHPRRPKSVDYLLHRRCMRQVCSRAQIDALLTAVATERPVPHRAPSGSYPPSPALAG